MREIGAGGMGVVYQAEDTTLARQVALKILPPELAADEERRLRFTREARAVAALNHPNIVTVHSVEESGGVHFITMELVKGRMLGDVIPPHGLTIGRFSTSRFPVPMRWLPDTRSDIATAIGQPLMTPRIETPSSTLRALTPASACVTLLT